MRQLKKFYVRTYGCQMNELDSEIMVGQLENRGLQRTDNEYDADLLIFNTCSIRDLAERKVMEKSVSLVYPRQPAMPSSASQVVWPMQRKIPFFRSYRTSIS